MLVRAFDIQFLDGKPIEVSYIKFKQTSQILHTSAKNGLYSLLAPIRKNAFIASSADKTEYSIKWNGVLEHTGPDLLSKASRLVDRINHNEVKHIKNHQFVPCIYSGTKMEPIPTPKLKIYHQWELTHTYISAKVFSHLNQRVPLFFHIFG